MAEEQDALEEMGRSEERKTGLPLIHADDTDRKGLPPEQFTAKDAEGGRSEDREIGTSGDRKIGFPLIRGVAIRFSLFIGLVAFIVRCVCPDDDVGSATAPQPM